MYLVLTAAISAVGSVFIDSAYNRELYDPSLATSIKALSKQNFNSKHAYALATLPYEFRRLLGPIAGEKEGNYGSSNIVGAIRIGKCTTLMSANFKAP